MSERAVATQLTVADKVPLAPAVARWTDGGTPLLGIETHPSGYKTLVVVSGAIDIVSEQALHNGLRQALTRSDRGIDLDLSGVDFCDCSGLNVLLRLRRRALDDGKIITIRAAGAAVFRLLSITGTLPLFTVDGETDETAVPGEADEAVPPPDTPPAAATTLGADITALGESNQDLRIEVVQLRRAMQTRPVIDLARGVLMASFGLSSEDAWQVLVAVSQNTNTKLHEVADSLVGAVTGDALPEPVRLRIAETVAELRTASEDPDPVASWGREEWREER
ncbi:ANTAR domain-containing protein [Streptomyces sp. ADMS]|uniref:ANTAR domain-containing protein n=1 Tax=Streptomyces sp. ADMS TaxID=3071415 RepID=UPI00296E6892|nr:ANTAR domain-containing protein [Streptomyces sp. ADMS]MDW4910037.1 ANTAR domain-containing protein [Streptomyces sp. ADMS]